MGVSASSILPSTLPTDVESLRNNAPKNAVQAAEVAQQLEAVFASMLIKEMRNTLSEGLFGGENSDVLGGMFDLHMGQAMTDGRGLGIKQLVLDHSLVATNETKMDEDHG